MKKILKYLVLFLFVVVVIVMCMPGLVFAVDYSRDDVYVNVNYTGGSSDGSPERPWIDIQNGIDYVNEGGRVFVASGTYYTNLDIYKSLSLIGSGSGSTTIDGGGTDSVIWLLNAITVYISGFKITNGHDPNMGGGLSINGLTKLTINNCNITDNITASGRYGGGIYNNNSSVFINSSVISNNYSEEYGGGIYNSGGTITINFSQIISNTALVSGGGIYNQSGTVTIHDSAIYGNTATSYPGIHDISGTSTNAQNNWWGTPTGPYHSSSNPTGTGNAVSDYVYFVPWQMSNPFAAADEEVVRVRTMPMTCWQVWINEDNNFQFIFWYPYKDNNWVRIYDMEDNMVFEVDLPVHDPNLIVDLPDGFYMVKTFHNGEPLQEFLIGKP